VEAEGPAEEERSRRLNILLTGLLLKSSNLCLTMILDISAKGRSADLRILSEYEQGCF